MKVGQANKDVEVVSTAVLSDENGSAVAVELKNNSNQPQVNLPILIDVLDAKKQVRVHEQRPRPRREPHPRSADPPGRDDLLGQRPGARATGTPKSVEVKVGSSDEDAPSEIPELAVSEPQINIDPSGIEVEGSVTNQSKIDQQQLVLFSVAKRGDEVVAAGRGQFKNVDGWGQAPSLQHFLHRRPERGADRGARPAVGPGIGGIRIGFQVR